MSRGPYEPGPIGLLEIGSTVLNSDRLILLAHVGEMGSVTAAAKALNYTPSAVSQQLKKLEEEAGQTLLTRAPDGVTPNEAGQMLIRHARRIQELLAAAEADLAEVAGLKRGTLTIGTFTTVGSSFLPFVIREFKSLYPSINLGVFSSTLDGLLVALNSGVVQMSLLWDYEWDRFSDEDYELVTIFSDPTVLLVSEDHRLANRRSADLAELANEDWVERGQNSRVSDVLERCCRLAGFTPRLAVHAGDYQETQAMVGVGLGIALAPLSAVLHRQPGVRVISLRTSAPPRRILLAMRRGRVKAPSENAMIQVIKDAAKRYVSSIPTKAAN
jgi:LysR family transcriptional regulator, transcription activator of glutamate synthase operon